MEMAFEQKIRERAYGMWVAAGMVHGMANEHWLSAEQAVKHDHAKPTKTRVKASMMHSDSVVETSRAVVSKRTAAAAAPATTAAAKTAAAKASAAKPAKKPAKPLADARSKSAN